MNLLSIKLAYKRINHTVSSEAKQIVRQVWEWLKKVGGESCTKQLFGYVIRDLLREFIFFLMGIDK